MNTRTKFKNIDTINIYNSWKKEKFLGVFLIKHTQDLHAENHTTLWKKSKKM